MGLIGVDFLINIYLKLQFSLRIDHILQKFTGFCVLKHVENSHFEQRGATYLQEFVATDALLLLMSHKQNVITSEL